MLEERSIAGRTRRAPRPTTTEAVQLLMQSDTHLGDLDLLDVLLDRPEWHSRAACRGMGTERFFPADHVALLDARRICSTCPVQSECGEFAMGVPSLKGIWAGMSERGRARARKEADYAGSPAQADEAEYVCDTVSLRSGAGRRRQGA